MPPSHQLPDNWPQSVSSSLIVWHLHAGISKPGNFHFECVLVEITTALDNLPLGVPFTNPVAQLHFSVVSI